MFNVSMFYVSMFSFRCLILYKSVILMLLSLQLQRYLSLHKNIVFLLNSVPGFRKDKKTTQAKYKIVKKQTHKQNPKKF